MKNFLIITSLLGAFVLMILCSSTTLASLFENDYTKKTQMGEVGEAVYASGDLGFVLEEEGENVNCISYKSGNVVIGECVWMNGGESWLNYVCDKLGLLITKKYTLGNKLMIEGVSAKLHYYISGRQENIQIVASNNVITIGSPIIYGSY